MKNKFPFPPPYGILNNFFGSKVNDPPPTDWLPPGDPAGEETKKQAWEAWLDDRTDSIARVLWPRFNDESLEWEGPTANLDFMLELTRVDLTLLLEIQRDGILDKHITSVARPEAKTHHELFLAEDSIDDFKVTYHCYDPGLHGAALDHVKTGFFHGLPKKVGSSHIQWKTRFQRPRPYQMAMLLGSDYREFSHEQAVTSLSPSLVSGHSLQGLLGGGAIIEYFLEHGAPSAHTLECLEQWAVDVGDRRVMARLHYPGDNISSWIGGMYLADRVYRSADVKRHLWHAISTKSIVYKLIIETVEKKRGDVYKPALETLATAAKL